MQFAIASLLFIVVVVGVHSAPPGSKPVGDNGAIGSSARWEALDQMPELYGKVIKGILGESLDNENEVKSVVYLIAEAVDSYFTRTPLDGFLIDQKLENFFKILGDYDPANIKELPLKTIQEIEKDSSGLLTRPIIRTILQKIQTILRDFKLGKKDFSAKIREDFADLLSSVRSKGPDYRTGTEAVLGPMEPREWEAPSWF